MEAHNVGEERTSHRGGRVGMCKGVKCAYLETRSTTVRMTDLPPTFRSPSTKSMEMSAQTTEGTSKGRNKPAGCSVSVLLRW